VHEQAIDGVEVAASEGKGMRYRLTILCWHDVEGSWCSAFPPGDEHFLDWDAASGLSCLGSTVGSHSPYHAILAPDTPAEQDCDLGESPRLLQEGLCVPVGLLAYPNGTAKAHSGATRRGAASPGFAHASTMRSGLHTAGAGPHEIRSVGLMPLVGPREWRWSLRAALATAGEPRTPVAPETRRTS